MNVGDRVRSVRSDNTGATGMVVEINTAISSFPIIVRYDELHRGCKGRGYFYAHELEQVTELEEVEKIVADLQNTVFELNGVVENTIAGVADDVAALSEKLDTLAVIVLRLLEQ